MEIRKVGFGELEGGREQHNDNEALVSDGA